MTQPNPSTAMATAIVDELSRHGVEFVVLSPGSRSGALAIAADSQPGIVTQVVLDERSAAFMALGRAKATGTPSAVISTSGTAVANLFPAVVEADMAMTPLVLISADRPAELRGVGANQTIDQIGIFGSKVRLSAVIEAPRADVDGNDEWRSAVSRAVMSSMGSSGPPGPVHLDVAFREPTVPVPDDGRSQSPPYAFPIAGRDGGAPWLVGEQPTPPVDHSTRIPPTARGLIVAGDGLYDRPGLLAEAERLAWPVVATALSGLRGFGTISAYHHALADGAPAGLRPDVVVAVGAIGPSQRLEGLIAGARVRLRVDAWGRQIDPYRNATAVLRADPVSLLAGVEPVGAETLWPRLWSVTDEAVRAAISDLLRVTSQPTGPGIAEALGSCDWDALVVSSSLPVRDIDAQLNRSGRVIGNRGASGIDGLVSTAFGAASAIPRTVAFTGDLSLFHDSNGFFCADGHDLVIVVADNNGGGLFDLLPQARHAPGFERLFIAPPGRETARLADLHRIAHVETDTVSALPELLAQGHSDGGVTLIRVPVDRRTDLVTRNELDAAGAEAARSVEA